MLRVVTLGESARLNEILRFALRELEWEAVPLLSLRATDFSRARVLFAAALDEYGLAAGTEELLGFLRGGKALCGAASAMLIDGKSELYTKEYARTLAFSLSLAGSILPPRPMVEATGSLENFRVLSRLRSLSLMEACLFSAGDLVNRLISFQPDTSARPRVLMIHASNQQRSNTLALGAEVEKRLADCCDFETISLLDGPIHDCYGCGHRACLHYAEQESCYYGGFLPENVFPALERADAVLMLCPNYNDAVSANHMALINRLNALLLRAASVRSRYLFAIVVSGYSGGDIVAKQLLGALCLNKPFTLPPHFCLLETANFPGDAIKSEGINKRLDAFARGMRETLTGD